MHEYSKKEIQMFTALNPFYKKLIESNMAASGLYRIAVEDCFVQNLQGSAVESLRRTATALRDCKPYRMTPEFDSLISL